jgi:asparagine synthase (glutamine-hydrolysing)
MSVQFGRWNWDGKPVDPAHLAKVKPVVAPYGPDDEGIYAVANLSILYRAFHTTKESRRETQPHVCQSGAVITWDGRLDNRAELIRGLSDVLTASSTDISIVAAAYEKWGANSFARLVGDWALSIWDAKSRSLTLAKDLIGTRHLYYSIDNGQVTWSTILDPLVLFAGKSFALSEEYIAGWFSLFPHTHLTPYIGIHSVPPSSSVLIRAGKHTVSKYWDFDPSKKIRYRTDGEYEEHFLTVFAEAVRRRLRSDSPILAELSGGMDSSSIVCMADTIIARGAAETTRLDTLSYYDDSEPNWNERPYFTKVEEKRGRTGTHIDVSKQEFLNFELANNHFAALPGSGAQPTDVAQRVASCVVSQGNRVILSGIGGDEVTGGVPTPIPELDDLLATGQFRTLAHQLKVWALNKRVPWLHLFFMSAGRFLPTSPFGIRHKEGPEAWLDADFVKRNRAALRGFQIRVKLFGPSPSFQENLLTLNALQRQLSCDIVPSAPPRENRYPYLDRNLLEFMYAIPREQLVRPGSRRSLLRRALRDLVPKEILERKRKAYVVRSPFEEMQSARNQIETLLADAVTVRCRLINRANLSRSLDLITTGQETKQMPSLMKTLVFELWLRTFAGNTVPENLTGHSNKFLLGFHPAGKIRAG